MRGLARTHPSPGVHGADPDVGHAAWVEKVEMRGDGVYISILEMAPASRRGLEPPTSNTSEGSSTWRSRSMRTDADRDTR